MFLSFEKWKRASVDRSSGAHGRPMLRDAAIVALLVLPIQVLHHVFPGAAGMVLVGLLSLLLVAGIVLKTKKVQ